MGMTILECTVHPLGEAPPPLKYTVMFTRYRGQWLHVRHKKRDTYECAGGHIEPGESPLLGAMREAREEAGVIDGDFIELFDYRACDEESNSSGRVFLVFARELENLSDEYEMAERLLSDGPPPRLTYPLIYNKLFPLVEQECRKKEGFS